MTSNKPFDGPLLPDAAWHLLKALRTEERRYPSPSLEHLYAELRKAGFVDGYQITQAGEEALRRRVADER